MNNDYFQTTDIHLASYLKMRDVDLCDVKLKDLFSKQCVFIFREDKNSERLLKLLDDWESKESVQFKRLLNMHGFMKKQVKDCLNTKPL